MGTVAYAQKFRKVLEKGTFTYSVQGEEPNCIATVDCPELYWSYCSAGETIKAAENEAARLALQAEFPEFDTDALPKKPISRASTVAKMKPVLKTMLKSYRAGALSQHSR